MTTVVLAPMLPQPTGNGLAMRIGAQLRALAADGRDVRLVVVPIAGGSTDERWARLHARSVDLVAARETATLRSAVARLLADPVWRDRLARAAPLPDGAARASPALAAGIAVALGPLPGCRVHAVRAALAPLAVALAERLGAPAATLDLDDDEQPRLVEVFGPAFRWLSLASAEDAARVTARSGLPTVVLPNSVELPAAAVARTPRAAPPSLLLVGNLTYPPNVEAAALLAHEIGPRVRELVGGPVTVELVGRHDAPGPVAALAALPQTQVRGYVDDLTACYAAAAVVVVPLREGSGTRIKLLEALAAGVPIVTSTLGAAGLDLVDGKHALLADDAEVQARAVARILADPALAARLAAQGRAHVERRFGSSAVAATIRRLVLGEPLSG